jgi:hypothetical protein
MQVLTAVTATPFANTSRKMLYSGAERLSEQSTQKLSEPGLRFCITGVPTETIQP